MMKRPIHPRFAQRRRAVGPALSLLPLTLLLAGTRPAMAAGWLVEPSVSVTETLSDNQRLSAVKESDSVTQASAGIRLSSGAGLIRGFFDYSLTAVAHARQSRFNEFQNALSAAASAELADKRAFVDLRASISQQAVSAFGTQASDQGFVQDNRTEVRSISVAPYLRGSLGRLADYELRLSHQRTDSGTAEASNVSDTVASLNLHGGGAVFGWSSEASRQSTDFSAGRRTESDRLRGMVRYAVGPELTFGANAGREMNDVLSAQRKSYATWGGQVNWNPSVRTTLAASYEHRFFGASHSVTFQHRTARTVWTFVDSRDASVDNGRSNVRAGSNYDLFFTQFATIEPDPIRRDVLVRTFLQSNGIDPNTPVVSGFLASAATVQRLQSLSFALLGLRSTLTVRALQSQSRRLDKLVDVRDDLSSADQVRQRGLVVDVAHRLTPTSSVNLAGSYQKTTGSLETQATALKSVVASWAVRTGLRSNLLVGGRHTAFESTANPYRENAIFASLVFRF